MQEKPPRVPTAAQTAGASTGPRVLPGTYTVRLTKGTRRRRDAARRLARPARAVHARGPQGPVRRRDEGARALRAHERRRGPAERLPGARGRAREGPARGRRRSARTLDAFAAKADAIRKDVVATSEGGAITGEERLREHLAYVYDAILSYEGRPGDYQVERVAVLERELKDVEARAAALAAKDLPALNEKLRAKKLAPIDGAAPDAEFYSM